MKQVIKPIEPNTVSFYDAVPAKYYGVMINQEKGFITRAEDINDPQNDMYIVLSCQQLTTGCCWPSYTQYDLVDLIEKLINDKRLVYEFDTPNELFAWLAKID